MSQTQNILLHLFLVFESMLAHNLRSKTSCFAIVSHKRNYSITSVTGLFLNVLHVNFRYKSPSYTTDYEWQFTGNTYRPITRPVIVQPNLSQRYNNFDKTSTTRLRLAWQPTRQDWLPKQHFLVKTTTTRTLLDGTLTVTLIPTLRPTSTLALFTTATIRTTRQWLDNWQFD